VPGFLSFVLGKGSGLYPFEICAIEEVVAHLEGEAGLRLKKQVEAINKVQRISGGKEVNLYAMSHGKPAFDECLRFSSSGDEALLATVSLASLTGEQDKLRMELWLANGRLFSLVFNKRPRDFFLAEHLRRVQSRIIDVKIWFNPMHPRDVSRPEKSVPLSGWLKDWYKKGKINGIKVPLSEQERMAALASIDAALPSDYVDIISQTDGAKIGDCTIHGAENIRKIVLENANYYVLVDTELTGGIVVKEGTQDGELYAIDYEDDSLRPIGKSLKDAIENM